MQDLIFFLREFMDFLFNWNSRLAFLYLAGTVVLAYVIWCARGRPNSFVSWLLPRDVYLHKSNLVDGKIFAFNTLLTMGGAFTAIAATPAVSHFVLTALSGDPAQGAAAGASWTTSALATLIIVLTLDFCVYWTHRIHHETQLLWPFHAVHHSAEVMTPLTVQRKHPMYIVIGIVIRGLILGSVQGVMLYVFVGHVDVMTIGSVNAAYFTFNMLGSNLRHSHIWLSYGRVLEHVFISPAQHHIHHSKDKKHYNKNYGEVFAIWDLMFGTLYVPKTYEDITFGLADANGQLIEQPHPTLRAAMLHPFVESWEALWKGTSRDPAVAQNAAANSTPAAQ